MKWEKLDLESPPLKKKIIIRAIYKSLHDVSYVGHVEYYGGRLRIALCEGGGMLLDYLSDIWYIYADEGMKESNSEVRMKIASRAMAAILSNSEDWSDSQRSIDWVSATAVKFTDGLIAELNKPAKEEPDDLKSVKLGQEQ